MSLNMTQNNRELYGITKSSIAITSPWQLISLCSLYVYFLYGIVCVCVHVYMLYIRHIVILSELPYRSFQPSLNEITVKERKIKMKEQINIDTHTQREKKLLIQLNS